MRANCNALVEMIKSPSSSGWNAGRPNPGWLHRSIWDTQVPYVVQVLDSRTLKLVVEAYASIDSVPLMRLASHTGLAVQYANGAWVDDYFKQAYEAFRPANDYLGDFVAELDRQASWPPLEKVRKRIRQFVWRTK